MDEIAGILSKANGKEQRVTNGAYQSFWHISSIYNFSHHLQVSWMFESNELTLIIALKTELKWLLKTIPTTILQFWMIYILQYKWYCIYIYYIYISYIYDINITILNDKGDQAGKATKNTPQVIKGRQQLLGLYIYLYTHTPYISIFTS